DACAADNLGVDCEGRADTPGESVQRSLEAGSVRQAVAPIKPQLNPRIVAPPTEPGPVSVQHDRWLVERQGQRPRPSDPPVRLPRDRDLQSCRLTVLLPD